MKYLVTGTAGFIGHFVALRLLKDGHTVVGLDNINEYYDKNLKYGRLEEAGFDAQTAESATTATKSKKYEGLSFLKLDLTDKEGIEASWEKEKFDRVIHLAAQAGVRYSLENPQVYIDSNMTGTLNILEACRKFGCQHLVYASSSSVYGLNEKTPFHTSDPVDHPISLYATTKRANELLAHNYSYLFQIPTKGLRFFTVYGPWGRPDMALFKFTKAMLEGKEIDVYNHGDLSRDFTYIDDIVEGVVRAADVIPTASTAHTPDHSNAPYRIFNIGRGLPVQLMDFVHSLEEALGVKAKKRMLPMQPGDVSKTWADAQELFEVTNFKPTTNLSDGVKKFAEWYRSYFS